MGARAVIAENQEPEDDSSDHLSAREDASWQDLRKEDSKGFSQSIVAPRGIDCCVGQEEDEKIGEQQDSYADETFECDRTLDGLGAMLDY